MCARAVLARAASSGALPVGVSVASLWRGLLLRLGVSTLLRQLNQADLWIAEDVAPRTALSGTILGVDLGARPNVRAMVRNLGQTPAGANAAGQLVVRVMMLANTACWAGRDV